MFVAYLTDSCQQQDNAEVDMLDIDYDMLKITYESI